MQHKYFLIFLLSPVSMHAMELITTHHSSGIVITDDLFLTAVCSRLDRPARDTLRCTCTKYFKIIPLQDELNKEYVKAFYKKDDSRICYWKGLGGLFPHQEFANAIKNKKDKFATWLLEKGKVQIWNAYCLNMQDAVETLTIDEMLPVITWLLYTRKPEIFEQEFCSSYGFARKLKEHHPKEQYPHIQQIIDLFDKYRQKEEPKKRVENIAYMGNISHLFMFPGQARVDYF
jgi:hypothetical protein